MSVSIAGRGFRQDFHTLRGITISLIVGAHTLPSFNWQSHPLLHRLIDTVCNESSVIFFFIAGFLFHHLSARFSYGPYLQNKLVNVIIPYLLLSIPAIILFVYFVPKYNAPWQDAAPAYQIFMYYLTGRHLAPLWFVPTIAMYYLAAPGFLWADRKATWLYWSLPALIALSVYLGRDAFWGPVGKAVYLFPAYFGGIFVSRYRNEVEAFVTRAIGPLLVLCLLIYVAMVEGILPKSAHIGLKLLFALLLLHALRKYERQIGNALDYVADISFGIFFIHAYIIGVFAFAATTLTGNLYETGGEAVFPATLTGYLTLTMAVLGLSIATIWIAQKLFGRRSRMLVGA